MKTKLQEVSGATGIPLSALGRIEADDDVRAEYQDIAALAKFYGVSIVPCGFIIAIKKHEKIKQQA